MYTKNIVKAPKRRERRRHPEEFKREVVDACLQAGVSMAAVALANGLNANMVRRWVKDLGGEGGAVEQSDARDDAPPARLVPVTVAPIRRSHHGSNRPINDPMSVPETGPTDGIQIEIRRDQTVVQVIWPVSQAAVCAEWLREILR